MTALSQTYIIKPVMPCQKRWILSDLCVNVPILPGGRERGHQSPGLNRREGICMIKIIVPPHRTCFFAFPLCGSKTWLLLNKDLFVLVILQRWMRSASAPGLFLGSSELLLVHTQNSLAEGCKPGLNKAPAAFGQWPIIWIINHYHFSVSHGSAFKVLILNPEMLRELKKHSPKNGLWIVSCWC